MKGQSGVGSLWTWTALCAHSKLIVSWRLGARDADNAKEFMTDVSERLANRVQMTTDGHAAYLEAVEGAFGMNIDYAMLVKQYGAAADAPETRYSPAKCLGTRRLPCT